jgi:hypothetical protein
MLWKPLKTKERSIVKEYQERSLIVKHKHFYTTNRKRSKFRKIKKAMEEKN